MLPGFSALSALRRSASVRTGLPSTERMMSGPPRWGSSNSTSHDGPARRHVGDDQAARVGGQLELLRRVRA